MRTVTRALDADETDLLVEMVNSDAVSTPEELRKVIGRNIQEMKKGYRGNAGLTLTSWTRKESSRQKRDISLYISQRQKGHSSTRFRSAYGRAK